MCINSIYGCVLICVLIYVCITSIYVLIVYVCIGPFILKKGLVFSDTLQ